jgi:Fe2+ transport system protein FeoA
LEFASIKDRQWQLLDASGKLLQQGSTQGSTLYVTGSALAPGAYLIQVDGQSTVLLKR